MMKPWEPAFVTEERETWTLNPWHPYRPDAGGIYFP